MQKNFAGRRSSEQANILAAHGQRYASGCGRVLLTFYLCYAPSIDKDQGGVWTVVLHAESGLCHWCTSSFGNPLCLWTQSKFLESKDGAAAMCPGPSLPAVHRVCIVSCYKGWLLKQLGRTRSSVNSQLLAIVYSRVSNVESSIYVGIESRTAYLPMLDEVASVSEQLELLLTSSPRRSWAVTDGNSHSCWSIRGARNLQKKQPFINCSSVQPLWSCLQQSHYELSWTSVSV